MKVMEINQKINQYLYWCVAGLQVSVVGLERALHQYTLEPSEKPFDMKTVPLATQPITEQRAVPGGCYVLF